VDPGIVLPGILPRNRKEGGSIPLFSLEKIGALNKARLRMSARKRFVPPGPAIPFRFHNNIPSWKGGELSLHPRADRQARKAGVMSSRPGRSSSFAQAGGFSTFTAPGPNRPAWSRLGRPLRNDIGPEKDAVSRGAALGHFFPIQSKPGDPIPRAMRSRWAGRSRIPASGVNARLFSKVFHQPF